MQRPLAAVGGAELPAVVVVLPVVVLVVHVIAPRPEASSSSS